MIFSGDVLANSSISTPPSALAIMIGVLFALSFETLKKNSLWIFAFSSMSKCFTFSPLISNFNNSLAISNASPGLSANLIPPALPLPPTKT